MLNFLRLRRADRESQHERTDLRTDLDETSALVLKVMLLLRRRRIKLWSGRRNFEKYPQILGEI